MYTFCNDTSILFYVSTATNITNKIILIKLQVFDLVESGIIVSCSFSNNSSNTDDDYNDIHDACDTRDDDQFENCISSHCEHELSLCNGYNNVRLSYLTIERNVYESYDFLCNHNLTDNYDYNIDTNNTSINSDCSDYSNYATCGDEFESLFDCHVKNNGSQCNEIANEQYTVFPCENDPSDCNEISERESDDFEEPYLVCQVMDVINVKIIISKQITTIIVFNAMTIWMMLVYFIKIFIGVGNVKMDRVYDTDRQLWVCQQNIPISQPAAHDKRNDSS